MNTADIRDQSTTQWAYWAAAIPLTLIVVVASLWGADALPSLTGALGRNRGLAVMGQEGGYVPLVERQRESEREHYPPIVIEERPRRRDTRSRLDPDSFELLRPSGRN
jgi:hypothetical protein